MHAFEWSQVAVRRRNVRIDPERVVYVISSYYQARVKQESAVAKINRRKKKSTG